MIVDTKTNKELELELCNMYDDLRIYRRAVIHLAKQMNTEQRTKALKTCAADIFGAVLGATMVASFSSKAEPDS